MTCKIYFDSDDFGGDGTLANPFTFDKVLVSSIIETQMNRSLAGAGALVLPGTHTFTTYAFTDDVKIEMAYDIRNANPGDNVSHVIDILAPTLGFPAWTATTNGTVTLNHELNNTSERLYIHEVAQNVGPGSHPVQFRVRRLGANPFGAAGFIQFNVVTEVERFL